ncbi:16S rRNA (cytidine(1402)-2'-O)-methyltransferase [Paenalcaligenes niemegkensis]|uniref:16S rRNA (cytidine(1402)-2'-O)-methyltransferase n=1 Tax=Paenalcaligenes niemegkensis TaxID=2895469 RepID=UPI001EE9844A|nr:16S rRNA (cytidine(1402)-2'-O)-methyltransferase [Paenalcaligenes niemegkensis]MCQ9615570.1 16S rRNA (cytidine(1402)-2'-O)-methyltransferase [Paenalcaligenes niemegkensis]
MNELSAELQGEATWKRLTERVGGQSWPAATLYVVATPIGNLADLGLRAWQTLLRCDVIAAEDTRSTRPLLQAWGVDTPLIAAHRHNEAKAAQAIVERLAKGERVALVSDAGAPAVSDPGARVVRAVREAGFRVVPIPGASAVIAALMATGVTTDENPAFAFAGFLPPKHTARVKWLRSWSQFKGPVLMFEGPHRLRASLADLLEVCGPDRTISIARELSKRFEQVHTVSLGDALNWLDADSHHGQGEFVLILHSEEQVEAEQSDEIDEATQAWMRVMLETLSVRDATKIAVKATGLGRDVLYSYALSLKG